MVFPRRLPPPPASSRLSQPLLPPAPACDGPAKTTKAITLCCWPPPAEITADCLPYRLLYCPHSAPLSCPTRSLSSLPPLARLDLWMSLAESAHNWSFPASPPSLDTPVAFTTPPSTCHRRPAAILKRQARRTAMSERRAIETRFNLSSTVSPPMPRVGVM